MCTEFINSLLLAMLANFAKLFFCIVVLLSNYSLGLKEKIKSLSFIIFRFYKNALLLGMKIFVLPHE